MKIVYLHQYFKTIHEAGSTRSYFICQELIRRGHEVIMITAKKDSTGEGISEEVVDGVKVYYIHNFYSNKLEVDDRIKSFVRFMLRSIPVLWKQKGINLVIATSTPLTVGFPALLYKWLKGVPYLFEVRDLWPEVPIQMGGLKNPIFKRGMLLLEKLLYKNASHIVALSPGMKDGVVKVLGNANKVSMIPNMAKKDVFYPRPINHALITEIGLQQDSFKVVHFGAMGIANHLTYILDAAVFLKQRGINTIEFVFLGEGRVTESLMSYCKKNNLDNVFFLGRKPMTLTAEIVNFCDVSVVSFANIPILATNSPNKFFDSLSAAKPIIVNSAGWTKDIVEENDCGAFVHPDYPEELANLIEKWMKQPEELVKMGLRGRKIANERYDESLLCKQFVNVVDHLKLTK